MNPVRVLVLQNETSPPGPVRGAFARGRAKFVVTATKRAEEAIEIVRAGECDIALVDDKLSGRSGRDMVRELHRENPALPVIMTAERGSDELTALMAESGVADFILKDADYCALLPRLALAVVRRKTHAHQDVRRPANNPNHIYQRILEAAADLLDIKSSSIMQLNTETGLLETRAHMGLSHNFIRGVRPRPGTSIEGLAVEMRKPVRCGNMVRDPDYDQTGLAKTEGLNSVLSIPFRIESVPAVVNLYSRRANRFNKTDERLAGHLVKLSDLALETLTLYYRERHIAETLQRSHFPAIETRFHDWEAAHRYNVSMREALLGGDFYDLFAVPGNRRALVVADVSGKGIAAATQTAMIKYTLRSYALEDPDPATVIARTNAAFNAFSRTDHFVTLFYAVIDPERNTLTYCSAGHPPPLYYSSRSRRVSQLEKVHLPIGVWDGLECDATTVTFSPGDTLLVYTDGLTDCRERGWVRGELFGQANLESLFAGCAGSSAEQVADAVLARVLDFSRGKMHDDAAFFVIRLLEPDHAQARPDKSFAPTGPPVPG